MSCRKKICFTFSSACKETANSKYSLQKENDNFVLLNLSIRNHFNAEPFYSSMSEILCPKTLTILQIQPPPHQSGVDCGISAVYGSTSPYSLKYLYDEVNNELSHK